MFLSKKLKCSVVIALAWLAVACASPSDAAVWAPEITMETRYDDNILKRPNGPQDLVGALIPRFRLLQWGGVFPWEVRARRTFVSYSRDLSPIALSDLAMGRGAYYFAARESISADYRYTRSTEPVDLENDAIVTGSEVTSSAGGVGLHAWRGDVDVRAREWSYARTDLADGLSRTWMLRAYPMRNRYIGWSVGYRGQALDLGDQGIRSHVVTTGVLRQHASWLSSEAELGVVDVAYDDGTPDQRHPAFAVGIDAKRGEKSRPIVMHLGLAHDLATTGLAEVRRGWGNGAISAKWESMVDVEGGIYRRPTLSRRVSLGFETSPDHVRRVAVNVSYRQVRPFRGAGYDSNILRGALSLAMPIKPWLMFEPVYDIYRQDAPGGSQSAEFLRHRLVLSFTAGLAPWCEPSRPK